MVKSFTFGRTIVANGWYLQVAVVIYILFYVVFRIRTTFTPGRKVVAMTFLLFGYIGVCREMGLPTYWYNTVLAFSVAMLIAMYEKNVLSILKKHPVFYTSSVILLFGLSKVASLLWRANDIGALGVEFISNILFGVMIYLIVIQTESTKFCVLYKNPVFLFLGKRSFEIYAVQGVFLMLFQSSFVMIENPYLYAFSVFGATIIAAVLLNPVFAGVSNWATKITVKIEEKHVRV